MNNNIEKRLEPTMKSEKLKQLFTKYWHIVYALYIPIYLISFFSIESIEYDHVTIIHSPIDDLIPFCKYFIIPYLLWFIYMALPIVFFFFYSQNEFVKYVSFLIIGMSTCLVLYVVFPSGLELRPDHIDTSDIFGSLVNFVYTADNSYNVCPSIHCLNSFGAHIAIRKCEYFQKRPAFIYCSFILVVLICLSTFFLKQHSIYDCLTAIPLAAIIYLLVYKWSPRILEVHKAHKTHKSRRKITKHA